MEHWIVARGYEVLPPEQVNIPNYFIPLRSTQPLVPTSIDTNLPYILEKLFQGTIAVRVVQKTITKQFAIKSHDGGKYRKAIRKETRQIFLFVRNVMEKKCSKKDIMVICARFIPLADCILFASGIAPQLEQIFYRRGIECKKEVQLMPLKDVTFDKLETRLVPQYVLLNEPEIVQLEKRMKVSRDHFPRLHATSDAMGRYLGLRPGMIVQTSATSYRIVTH